MSLLPWMCIPLASTVLFFSSLYQAPPLSPPAESQPELDLTKMYQSPSNPETFHLSLTTVPHLLPELAPAMHTLSPLLFTPTETILDFLELFQEVPVYRYGPVAGEAFGSISLVSMLGMSV